MTAKAAFGVPREYSLRSVSYTHLLKGSIGGNTPVFYEKTFENASVGLTFSKAAEKNYLLLKKDGMTGEDIDIIRQVCGVLGRYDAASQVETINKALVPVSYTHLDVYKRQTGRNLKRHMRTRRSSKVLSSTRTRAALSLPLWASGSLYLPA